MPPAPQATIDLFNDYFGALEAKDYERLRSYYADNITLTFANANHHRQRSRARPHGRVDRQAAVVEAHAAPGLAVTTVSRRTLPL